MRTLLEKAHDVSSIGTFVLTIVVVALMVIPMLSSRDSAATASGGQLMSGWLMPSILAVCILLAGFLNLLAARSRYQSPPGRVISSRIAPPDVTGNVVTPISPAAAIPEQETPLSFPATVRLVTLKIPVGSVQEFAKTKIEVREIRKHLSKSGEGEYGAVLYVNTGGGLIWGGESVTKISTNCYYLPLSEFDTKVPYSIYSCRFSNEPLFSSFSSFSLYLEHINPHSGVVTMKVCQVQGAGA